MGLPLPARPSSLTLVEPLLDTLEVLAQCQGTELPTATSPARALASTLSTIAIDEPADDGLADLHALVGQVVSLTHGALHGLATVELDLAASEPLVRASARDLTLSVAFAILDCARSIAESRPVRASGLDRLRIRTRQHETGVDVIVEARTIRHVLQLPIA